MLGQCWLIVLRVCVRAQALGVVLGRSLGSEGIQLQGAEV